MVHPEQWIDYEDSRLLGLLERVAALRRGGKGKMRRTRRRLGGAPRLRSGVP